MTAQEPVAYELVAVKFANGKQLVYAKPENLASYITARPLVYPAPVTHPAKPLSDDEILNCFYADRSKGEVKYMLAVGRAIEAHIKGGAQK